MLHASVQQIDRGPLLVYQDGVSYEVEFTTFKGPTTSVVTLAPHTIRPIEETVVMTSRSGGARRRSVKVLSCASSVPNAGHEEAAIRPRAPGAAPTLGRHKWVDLRSSHPRRILIQIDAALSP